MKVLLGLPLRQTQGFVQSVLARRAGGGGRHWTTARSADTRSVWRCSSWPGRAKADCTCFRAIEVTDNRVGDVPMLPELLGQIPAEEAVLSVGRGGAYDAQSCHEAIAGRGAEVVIPTRKNAQPWKARRPGAAARN